MIKARFIKATPTKDGITYILQGERTKDALRAAAEFDDEICDIELEKLKDRVVNANEVSPEWYIFNEVCEAVERGVKDAYELGKQEEQARHDLPAPEGE
jgi:hypothetical protein